jgi:hypothetical protein
VLDHLINKLPRSIPVLCIYFEQKPTSPYTPNNLLGSLLKQLVQARELGLPAGLKAAYVEASRINAKLTQQEMKTILEVSACGVKRAGALRSIENCPFSSVSKY